MSHSNERYARHCALRGFGENAQQKITQASVLVVGAGGLGSPVLQYLVGAGVGTVGILDNDVVAVSNLHRQVLHTEAAVGIAKVTSAIKQLRELNSTVNLVGHNLRLTEDNASTIIGEYDLVVDCSDNFATRYLIDDVCAELKTPTVWGVVGGYYGQVSVFLHSQDGQSLRDLYPQVPAPGTIQEPAETGTYGPACGITGSIMASQALKLITGLGSQLIGQVVLIDALSAEVRTVAFR
ncbi:MAG: HesA/MoeB/ThiF family protein [Actinomycetaceae bacterium]|nr:HesA/MoeB/ThiF family protein [Actinomycetaceae bacterium]